MKPQRASSVRILAALALAIVLPPTAWAATAEPSVIHRAGALQMTVTPRSLADGTVVMHLLVEDAPTAQDAAEPQGGVAYRSAYQEVLAFHDVASDARAVSKGLTRQERQQLHDAWHAGEDVVAQLKQVRESDHVQRGRLVAELRRLREELAALRELGRSVRWKGHPFVAARRVGGGWSPSSYQEGGFRVLRTRFVDPGSAFVAVRNDAGEGRALEIELQFVDAFGQPTGRAVAVTGTGEDLAPGEVRELLLPLEQQTPRFWDVTTAYTIRLK